MSRLATLLLPFILISVQAGAQQHIHKRELKHKFMFKGALIKTGVSALWAEARNSPHEWGRTWSGLAKRAGSSYAQRAVKGVVEFSISSAWTHEDLRYHKSNVQSTWPRIFAAGQVSRTWMPSRVATFGAGVSSGGLSIGLDVGLNVVREFWPKRH